jgi:Uma2 family endonuclease
VEVFVPDLAGWRRDRMPDIPQDQRFEIVPDWICEVLSPSTASKDRAVKMPLYARYGVQYVWLVDPLEKILEVFKLTNGTWLEAGSYRQDEIVSAVPFDEISISLSDLWC